MCGISGIIGSKNISGQLLNSIRNLEYRGYDSCGMALNNGKGISVKKNVGFVDDVERKEGLSRMGGKMGIAHTRWATHGSVSQANTHPHLSCRGDFACVHNGIISNYRALRESLQKEGHKFLSETDTEVIPHLMEKNFESLKDVEKAFVATLRQLEGTFAIAMISIYEQDRIYCAKFESPLILGLGKDANYIGSDFNAFIEYTKTAVILDSGEYAIVTGDSFTVKESLGMEPVEKETINISWDVEMSKKGGYPHYMLKEIYEQPQAIVNAMGVDREKIREIAEAMARSERTYLLGVGTTFYVAKYGQYCFSDISGCFLPSISSDEFTNLAEVDEKTTVLALSQSGETYDTLSAVRFAKERGAKIAVVVNVIGSSLSRLADYTVLQGSGPEICVISTKAAVSQMVILTRLAAEFACARGKINESQRDEIEKNLLQLPETIQRMLNEKSGFIHTLAHKYSHIKNWLYLGRGIYYPVALESALKMKEVSYVHAEGMPGGFLKHGTIAMIDSEHYAVVFVPPKEDKKLFDLTMGSIEEIKARKGFVLGFYFNSLDMNNDLFDERITLPSINAVSAPFLQLVAAQLFAYFTATALKRNIDKPRSLAKSVTVA
ncbi:MAG: glutamine--fructose-6-phosphate transaminase (isomerizing) [Nitrospinae bacterium]|nr:glutamine--fructose-6-phosphate transaminase (isomerizing) [Nitrospinota bacterium]